MVSKRHKYNNKLTKRQKGGVINDTSSIPDVMSVIKEEMKPGPGLYYAWILLGVSSVYMLSKLLTK